MLRKVGSLIATGCLCLIFISASAQEQARPDGTISVSATGVAVGIGYTWGDGILNYHGREHKFSISGLSVVDVGISNLTATGEVYDLKRLEDFNGTYAAAAAGATVGGGAGIATMENQNGVVIKITSTSQGARLTLAPAGVSITLKE